MSEPVKKTKSLRIVREGDEYFIKRTFEDGSMKLLKSAEDPTSKQKAVKLLGVVKRLGL